MEITVKGDPKEIAALVVALQERQIKLEANPDSVFRAMRGKDQEAQENT